MAKVVKLTPKYSCGQFNGGSSDLVEVTRDKLLCYQAPEDAHELRTKLPDDAEVDESDGDNGKPNS